MVHETDGENPRTFSHASFAPVLRGRVLQMGDEYSTSCNSYLSCVGMWLSRESHAKFAIPNARQLEHGNHCVCANVEVNIGTKEYTFEGDAGRLRAVPGADGGLRTGTAVRVRAHMGDGARCGVPHSCQPRAVAPRQCRRTRLIAHRTRCSSSSTTRSMGDGTPCTGAMRTPIWVGAGTLASNVSEGGPHQP